MEDNGNDDDYGFDVFKCRRIVMTLKFREMLALRARRDRVAMKRMSTPSARLSFEAND